MILCDDLQFIYHKMTYPFIWKKQGKKLISKPFTESMKKSL